MSTFRAEIGDAYYGEALDYHLGTLYAHIGEASLAAEHLARSNSLPTGGGDLLFADQVREGMALRSLQEAAKQRGIPSILISSMPRAASASLVQSIVTTLDIPILRFSAGKFANYVVIPRWLSLFLQGGAVAHDHFGATPFNLRALEDCDVKDVFVLIDRPPLSGPIGMLV